MNGSQFVQAFQRAIQPLKTRVLLMVGRAILTAVNDSKGIQTVQLKGLADESFEGVPRMQEFGFSSNPPKDTDAIMVAVGGSRESLVVIATDHKTTRVKNLASGESIIYTDDGTKIHLKKSGLIDITTATKVLITAPDVEITGNLKVGGTTLGVGAATYQATMDVTGKVTGQADIESLANVKAGINVQATALVQAAGYAGPAGGAPGAPMVTSVPISSTAAISTTADVSGGGTTLATVKAGHNGHTHSGVQAGGSNTGGPSTSV